MVETCETIDGDHGRIEVRRHRCATTSAGCSPITASRRGKARSLTPFPGLATIDMVERSGTSGRERRYHLASAKLGAPAFARAVRGHWGIENRLHWVLDVVFRDDLARLCASATARRTWPWSSTWP